MGIFILGCHVASIPVFDIASSMSANSSSFSLALRAFVRLLNAIGVALLRFSLHLYETPCICMFFLQVFCKCQCLDCGTLCSNPLIFLKFHGHLEQETVLVKELNLHRTRTGICKDDI